MHSSAILTSPIFTQNHTSAVPLLTHRSPHAVRLGVDEPSDLGEVAVPLGDELDGGGLGEESVVGGEHTLDPLLHVRNHDRGPPAVHELPHLIVRRDLGFLWSTSTILIWICSTEAAEDELTITLWPSNYLKNGHLFSIYGTETGL